MMYEMMQHPQKRQRRQAAALVVQSFFTIGKKSTAQPRPALHVPARGIGPIQDPNINDVLCGRGGRINAHDGNVQFRDLVAAHKKEYLATTTKKLEKAHIAARVVETIRTLDPPGRFLKEDSDTGFWFDIGDAKAIKKAGQALREDAPDIRTGDGSDDDTTSLFPKKTAPKSSSPAAPSIQKISSLASPPKERAPPQKESPAATAGRGPSRIPTSGRGLQQQRSGASFHSSSSSTFGMSFPNEQPGFPPQQAQHVPPPPPPSSSGYSQSAGSGVNFPSTTSVGSGQHSLQSRGMFPSNLYRGVRNMSTNLSKRATEMMHFQQQQHHAAAAAAYRQQHPTRRPGAYPQGQHPDEVAFGRQFTPTELSSGSTMSTMSGMSGISGFSNNTGSNMAGSHLGGASALSLGSSGLGPTSSTMRSSGYATLPSQHTQSFHMSRLGSTGLRGQMPPGQMPHSSRGSQVSDMTNSYMSASGLTRSPSFGELSSTMAGPMSDSSFVALMAEDQAVGDILANLPPHSSGTAPKSSFSRLRQQANPSSAMSVTSVGSNKSAVTLSTMKSLGSDNSWLLQHPYNRSNTKGSISSGEEGSRTWTDDRSLMSDVSEKIVALDLAAPSSMF